METDVFLHRDPTEEHGGDHPLLGLRDKGEILFYQETLSTGESQRDIKESYGKRQLPP